MNAIFYTTNDNPLKVDKLLNQTVNKTIAELGNISILAPSFIVDKDENVFTSNYCYISYFNRYYFIKNISIMDGGRLLIECNVDVLNSFANDIKKSPITVLRNGGINAPTNIPDSKLPILPNQETVEQTVDENNVFTNDGTYNYVLTVIGGDIT